MVLVVLVLTCAVLAVILNGLVVVEDVFVDGAVVAGT